MDISIGRTVHYTINEGDAAAIKSGRVGKLGSHQCNEARVGNVYPAVAVAVFSPGTANLVVQLDGPDTYWATSRTEGEGAGHWAWPPRV